MTQQNVVCDEYLLRLFTEVNCIFANHCLITNHHFFKSDLSQRSKFENES